MLCDSQCVPPNQRRNDVMLTFTDEGAPGYRYKAHFVKLMDNLVRRCKPCKC